MASGFSRSMIFFGKEFGGFVTIKKCNSHSPGFYIGHGLIIVWARRTKDGLIVMDKIGDFFLIKKY